MLIPYKNSSLLRTIFLVVLLPNFASTAHAETIIEWITESGDSRYGGKIHDRKFVSTAGEKRLVEASYQQRKGMVGPATGAITARGLALRCPSEDGFGWYGSITAKSDKESNYKVSSGYAPYPEGGGGIGICGASSAKQAVAALLQECERYPLCSSQTYFSLLVGMDTGEGGGSQRENTGCHSRTSYADLLESCRAFEAKIADSEALGTKVIATLGTTFPKSYKIVQIPPGLNPAIVDIRSVKNPEGQLATLANGGTRREERPRDGTGATGQSRIPLTHAKPFTINNLSNAFFGVTANVRGVFWREGSEFRVNIDQGLLIPSKGPNSICGIMMSISGKEGTAWKLLYSSSLITTKVDVQADTPMPATSFSIPVDTNFSAAESWLTLVLRTHYEGKCETSMYAHGRAGQLQ